MAKAATKTKAKKTATSKPASKKTKLRLLKNSSNPDANLAAAVIEQEQKTKKVIVKDNTRGNKATLHDEMKAELSDLTTQIKNGVQQIGAKFFEIGCALKIVRDKKLFEADGKKSFNAWLASERFFASRVTAYNLIAVGEKLTREQAIKHGPSISYAIARATDDEARQELETMANNGATATQLRQQAAAQRTASGVTSRSPGRKVKRAANVSTGSQPAQTLDVVIKKAVTGEKGTVELKPLKKNTANKAKIKAGWTKQVRFRVGEHGPELTVEVNADKGLLLYRVM